MRILRTTSDHLPALRDVLDATGLFPGAMLADMIDGFLSGHDGQGIWLTAETAGRAVGFCHAVPEMLTDGTWNMLAIAVLPSEQGKGCGGLLCGHLETELCEAGQRILIVETSGSAAFAGTRAFYRRQGYHEEARIRDFWAAGDDKVTFRKVPG